MNKYVKRFLDIFDFKNLLFESIILSFVIVFVDALNLPTLMIKNNCLFLLILVLIFFAVKITSSDNFKLFLTKNVNTVDKYMFIYSITTFILLIYVFGFDFKPYKNAKTKEKKLIYNQLIPLSLVKINIEEVNLVDEINTIEEATNKAIILARRRIEEDLTDKEYVISSKLLKREIKDSKIHYHLYTDNYKFITDNFQLISRL